MKHPDKCDCPVHIVEDTTKVKNVAMAVIAFWMIVFVAWGLS